MNWAISRYSAAPVQHAVLAFMRITGRERRFARRYMEQPGIKALQIGAGSNRHAGWLHTNWFPIRPWGRKSIFLDATRRFPFSDNTFDYIFSEHMIEHVPFSGGQSMLHECARVMKPGGRIRISTPDLRALAGLLGENLTELQQNYIEWGTQSYVDPGEPKRAISMFNQMMRDWGHTFIYDEETLREALAVAGFTKIVRREVNQSADAFLTGIDIADKHPEPFLNLISVVLEAAKPE